MTVPAAAHGTFVLVGTNNFGRGSTDATDGNRFSVVNAQDDGDSDGDGSPDGLELLYGSDPFDSMSVPDLRSHGDLFSAVVSVNNTTLPETVQHSALVSFSVLNTTLPETVEHSALVSFSVLNKLLPAQTQVTVVSPAVSVQNLTPAQAQQLQLQQESAAAGTSGSSTSTSVSLAGVSSGRRLIEGQTLLVGATVAGGSGIEAVTFTVNGAELAVVGAAPYVMAFTVPSGVAELVFGATARVPGAQTGVSAPTVSVGVDRDLRAAVSGRVVDQNGNPVVNAKVELVSDGLRAEYFDATTALGSLPDLTGATPTQTGRVTAINLRSPLGVFGFDPLGTGLAPDYAARFTGWLLVPSPGTYTFFLGADEGARLKVGGVTVVDMPNAAAAGFQELFGSVTLPAGLVPLEITYYESTGNAQLQLSVVPPSGIRQVVLPATLVPASEPFVVTTDNDGRFTLQAVPTVLQNVRIRVTPTGGSGVTVPLAAPLATSGTDVGEIVAPGSP